MSASSTAGTDELPWQFRDRQEGVGCDTSCVWPCKQHCHEKAKRTRAEIHLTSDDILSAAHSGCPVSQIFVGVIDRICACTQQTRADDRPPACKFKYLTLSIHTGFIRRLTAEWSCGQADLEVGVNTGPGSSSLRIPNMKTPCKTLEGTLRTCRDLYDVCTTDHETCPTLNDTDLPARVLDIGDVEEYGVVRLVDTSSSGRYAALSYMWGGMLPPTESLTLLDTIADRQRGMKFRDLPLSYQDAVRVTRELGLRYLWIDSLCIVQDDKDDWNRESSLMDQTFSRAAVVLIAAAASNVLSSFLDRASVRDSLQLSFICKAGTDSRTETVVRPSKDHLTHNFDACDGLAIDTRGWCYQERHMAQRRLIFRPDEIVWECHEQHCKCECALFEATSFRTTGITQRVGTRNQSTNLSGWMKAIEAFSRRKFTVATDRLVALTSLAKHFDTAPKKLQYLAGLWNDGSDTLILGLAWVGGKPVPRYTDYVAPTWSWASYNGEVRFVANTERNISIGQNYAEADVVTAWCHPTGPRLGAVDDGVITLRGLQSRGWLSTPGGSFNDDSNSEGTIFYLGVSGITLTGTSQIECCLDHVLTFWPPYVASVADRVLIVEPSGTLHRFPAAAGAVHLLRLTTRSILILIPREDDSYERVGVWNITGREVDVESIFADWAHREIKIY